MGSTVCVPLYKVVPYGLKMTRAAKKSSSRRSLLTKAGHQSTAKSIQLQPNWEKRTREVPAEDVQLAKPNEKMVKCSKAGTETV